MVRRHNEREAGEDFIGLDRFEARKVVVEELTELGAARKEEPYEHNVGFSQRSHVPIEPYLSEQWFLKYPSLEASTKAVEEGRIKFHPERWTKIYTIGCTTSRIGASAASFGGDIGFRSGRQESDVSPTDA